MANPLTATSRMRSYKNKGLDLPELRRRREEEGVQLRKKRRQGQLYKKRNSLLAEGNHVISTVSGSDNDILTQDFIQMVFSEDPHQQLTATQKIRKFLCKGTNPHVNEMILTTGVVNKLTEFLKRSEDFILQFEAAWALTDIALGKLLPTKSLIQAGTVSILIELLGSGHEGVRDQVAWLLGNIARDDSKCRDYMLDCNILPSLEQLLTKSDRLTTTRNAVWALSNLCRGKSPPPDFTKVCPCLSLLSRLLQYTDPDILTNVCWALSCLSDGTNHHIQAVVKSGVCPRLVQLLLHNEPMVVSPAVRTVGNIVTGDTMQTQVILDCSALPCLIHLLRGPDESIRMEACWAISNITAGNTVQIQMVIDAGIFPVLIEILQKADFSTKKEAVWAITNATSGGTPEQIRYLVSLNTIKPMCDLLTVMDSKIVEVSLNGLENILHLGEQEAKQNGTGVNPYCALMEEAYGLDKLEFLQSHKNQEIYRKAIDLVEGYFSVQEEEEEMAPQVDQDQAQFVFQPPNELV